MQGSRAGVPVVPAISAPSRRSWATHVLDSVDVLNPTTGIPAPIVGNDILDSIDVDAVQNVVDGVGAELF